MDYTSKSPSHLSTTSVAPATAASLLCSLWSSGSAISSVASGVGDCCCADDDDSGATSDCCC